MNNIPTKDDIKQVVDTAKTVTKWSSRTFSVLSTIWSWVWPLLVFLVVNAPWILLILLGIALLGGLLLFIVILFSLDPTNVPYYFTKQEAVYNLPKIELNYVKEYGYKDKIQSFFSNYGNETMAVDLLSNIYFYSDNQEFLKNIQYPIKVLDVGDLLTYKGETYSKVKGNDFYYDFTNSGSIVGLDQDELKYYQDLYKEAFSKVKPSISMYLSFPQKNWIDSDYTNQIKVNREVQGYGVNFDKVTDVNSEQYGNYRVSFYLNFKDSLKAELLNNMFSGWYQEQLAQKLVGNTFKKKNGVDTYIESLEVSTNQPEQYLYNCLRTVKNNYSTNNTTFDGELCTGVDIRATITELDNSFTTDFQKLRASSASTFNNNEVENTKNYEEGRVIAGIKRYGFSVSNPYYWFYEEYDSDGTKTLKTNKLQLNPQTFIYSIYTMKNQGLDAILGVDYIKEFLDINKYKYSYGSKLESTMENTVLTQLSLNNENLYSGFRNRYFPANSLKTETYSYTDTDKTDDGKKLISKSAIPDGFSKYWNYLVTNLYPENSSKVQLGEYYYATECDKGEMLTITEHKRTVLKCYFNIYNYDSNFSVPTTEVLRNKGFWSKLFSWDDLLREYNQGILYVDKGSENTYYNTLVLRSNIDANSFKAFRDKLVTKDEDGNARYNSDLDVANNLQDMNYFNNTMYFYFPAPNKRGFVDSFLYFANKNFTFDSITDEDSQLIQNAYTVLLNNKKIQFDYNNLLKGDRNPFEFITYQYDRYKVEDNPINLGVFIRAYVKGDGVSQANLQAELTYATYKDFWISFLRDYSTQETTDLQVLLNDSINYCKKYDDQASCLTTIQLFKEASNSDSNKMYYDNYLKLKELLDQAEKESSKYQSTPQSSSGTTNVTSTTQ